MSFIIDARILTTSIELTDWPLCRILLKNDRQYPWFMLVPKVTAVSEIFELTLPQRQQLMQEITSLAHQVQQYFNADKINIASLGNIVAQLHVHVVARYSTDLLWPQGIWQASAVSQPYLTQELAELLPKLRYLLAKVA